MSCEFLPNAENTVHKLSATYGLSTSYTGSASFADPVCGIDFSYIYTPIQMTVPVITTTCLQIKSGYECFNGNLYLLNGVISGISQNSEQSENQIDVSVESYFARLVNKPINTEPFLAQGANTVLTAISYIYAGIPGTFVNFSANERPVVGPVVGNNTLDEMRQVAQAGYSHLFVQHGGVLTAEPWQDCGAPELTIPCWAVIKASRSREFEIPPTVIRVRGRNVDTVSCGEQDLTDSRSGSTRGGYDSVGAGSHKCVITGISQKDATVEYRNLVGNKTDLVNANLYSSGLLIDTPTEVKDGFVASTVTSSGGWLGKVEASYYSRISGAQKSSDMEDKNGKKVKGTDSIRQAQMLKQMYGMATGTDLVGQAGPAWGKGVTGTGVWSASSDMTSAEPSRTQQEVVVLDPDLMLQYGVREEQLDNPYAYTKEQLFHIGIRRFQQWKMEQDSWQVEIIPMPCLRVNQIVSFETPEKEDCPSETVTGVINSIKIDWQAEGGKTTMQIGLLGTSNLCNTTYISTNLFTEMCGTVGDSGTTEDGWYGVNTSPYYFGSVSSDSAFLMTLGTFGNSYVYKVQEHMEHGASYLFTFDAEFLYGLAPFLTVALTSGGVPVASPPAIASTGSYSMPFTAVGNTHVFRFDLATIGVVNFWRISNLKLIKTVVG